MKNAVILFFIMMGFSGIASACLQSDGSCSGGWVSDATHTWCVDGGDSGVPGYCSPDGGIPSSGNPYGNSPFGNSPKVNPIENAVSGFAAAVGLGLLAGIAGLVGAPVVAAASGAAALVAGVMTAVGIGMGNSAANNAQTFVDAARPPLSVNLIPATSSPPAPVSGGTSTPSVATDPTTGQFVPGGGRLLDGSGASGGWSPGGASGEWTYTPPATASNPTPAPIAAITDGGYGVKQQINSTPGGTSSSGIYVQRYSDASVVVTNSATVPVSTSSGTPTTVDAAVSTAFGTDGSKFPGSSSTMVAPTLGNGANSGGGAGLNVSGFGGGTTTSVGTGSPGPAGGCANGDCATESTQLANKGLLQGIKEFLTGSATTPTDPQGKTGADIGSALGVYNSPLSGVKGWQLPAHSSQCPSGSFTIPGSSHVFSFDGHCQFAAQNLPLLSSIFLVLWNLAALWIVLRL